MAANSENTVPVIYYDGRCNFCHLLIQRFSKTKLESNAHLFPYQLVSNNEPSSLLFIEDSVVYEGGLAALRLLTICGGFYKSLSQLIGLLPNKIINRLYFMIARNRYRWFGTKSCVINYN
jgi:predicted DCC family thiol-disulfide oxidoreductase YuxK